MKWIVFFLLNVVAFFSIAVIVYKIATKSITKKREYFIHSRSPEVILKFSYAISSIVIWMFLLVFFMSGFGEHLR